MVGSIYLARIYFTDLSDYKIRPVLVIKEFGEDCLCLQLTTQLQHNGVLLNQGDIDSGELKKESMVVVPKSFTLHNSILIKQIAVLTETKLEEIFQVFCEKLGCTRF